MTAKANISAHTDHDPVRLCLVPGTDHSALTDLLNGLYHSEQYRVGIDVREVPRLGTVEIRILGAFADSFKRRGGFLKLENATAQVATLVRLFGYSDLLPTAADQSTFQQLSGAAQG